MGSLGGRYRLQTVIGILRCILVITAWSGVIFGMVSEWIRLWTAVSTPPLAGPSVSLSLRWTTKFLRLKCIAGFRWVS